VAELKFPPPPPPPPPPLFPLLDLEGNLFASPVDLDKSNLSASTVNGIRATRPSSNNKPI